MNDDLWIVDVATVHTGWQTPVIFREDQRAEMEKFILDEKLQHRTVVTTRIHGMAVEPLRKYFASEEK